MKLLTVDIVSGIIKEYGLDKFFIKLIDELEKNYLLWDSFRKTTRQADHFKNGVIELMPCSTEEYYTFKYVNGHPENPLKNKLSVIAFGALCDTATGYPLLLSEMTLLTAFRTAATSALAAGKLARKNSRHAAIIGTGSQSEFQILALKSVLPIQTISYFDKDKEAMKKFELNLTDQFDFLIESPDIKSTVMNADIIITATAELKNAVLFHKNDVKEGIHINAIGGDCPGKTEFEAEFLRNAKIVVEYLPQTSVEGEIQNINSMEIYAELHEIIRNIKPGRVNSTETTFFDSVGFALEDYTALRLIYEISEEFKKGNDSGLIPELKNPKNLFSLLK